MLLRTTRLRKVHIDPASRAARAQASAMWQDVTVPSAQHGLAALAGNAATVDVTRYTSAAGWARGPAATGWRPTASPRPSW
jgi:FAD/FMN-containing dehydrogenase